jgi:hypothetical protein
VIPKSFHEPLIDFSDDAQLSATLERELEAELFGREDVDATIGMHRRAEPFHSRNGGSTADSGGAGLCHTVVPLRCRPETDL